MSFAVDIVLAILFFVVAVGFCDGRLDWLMIYYGCAPARVKDNVDRKHILSVGAVGCIAITIVLIVSRILNTVLEHYDLKVGYGIALGIFIIFNCYCFYICNKAGKQNR